MMTEASSVGSIDHLMDDLDEMINFNDDDDVVDVDVDVAEASIPFQSSSGDFDVIGEAWSAEEQMDSLKSPSSQDGGEVAAAFATVAADTETDAGQNGEGQVQEGDGSPSPTAASRSAPQDVGSDSKYESFAIDATSTGGDTSSSTMNDDEEGGGEEDQQDEDQEQEDQEDQYGVDGVHTESIARPRLGRWFRRGQSEPRAVGTENGSKASAEPPVSSASARSISVTESENTSASQSRHPAPPPARRGLGRYARQVSDSIRNLRETAATLDYIEESKIRARETAMDPYSIISSPNCRARTLSISDHHATVLLIRVIPKHVDLSRRGSSAHTPKRDDEGDGSQDKAEAEKKDDEEDENGPQIVRALLKLSVAPFHKIPLGRKPMTAGDYADQKFSSEDMEASASILWFLSRYRFTLTSESGAEYSYYDAVPSQAPAVSQRAAGEVGLAQSLNMALHGLAGEAPAATKEASPATGVGLSNELMLGGFKVELIAPATDQQIRLEMPKPSSSLVKETSELYNTVTRPYIESILSGDSLDWIEDIAQGKTSTNGVLFDNEDYFLHIDTEWKSHPDPRKFPPEEWFDHSSISDLHIIGMLKTPGIASLRDLRGEHVPLLKSMLTEGLRMIHQLYGVDADQVRVYVPYPPQFYRFHMYFTRIDHTEGCLVESAHLVDDIIQNLEMDPNYYEKRTIPYKVKVTDDLYKRVWMHEVSKDTLDTLDDLDLEGDY